jgi:cyclic pyranopterin phosphate synthase
MAELYDRFNRKIDYLRLSITDRCNLRCFYCMPEKGIPTKPCQDILTYEEIRDFATAAITAGISKIRLIGGEPLIRRDVAKLIRMLISIPGLKDLSLTTNGYLLEEYLFDLKKAGLKRVNISIDSLDEATYKRITRVGELKKVLRGLKKALEMGLEPVKINVVLLKGINEDPRDFVSLTFDYPVHVRFIEFMPIGKENPWYPSLYVSINAFKEKLLKYGELIEDGGPVGAGPASYAKFKGAIGTVGFISPISNHFCNTCNRLRLTPDGRLRTCLFSNSEVNVKEKLRENLKIEELINFIRAVLQNKPLSRESLREWKVARLMSQIGG